MTTVEEAVKQPIVPSVSVGGVCLGDSKEAVLERLGAPLTTKQAEGDVEFLEYGPITVCIEGGRAVELVAEQGYFGADPSGLRVGTPWAELLRIYPNVAPDEEEYEWYVPGLEGMSLDIVRPPGREEQPMFTPWVDEWHWVQDPEHAFVLSIRIHKGRSVPKK